MSSCSSFFSLQLQLLLYFHLHSLMATDPNPNPNHTPVPVNGPFRRPKYIAFRLLCHASRVGGIIGKSGSNIKSLQEATGARIRIEDAPHDSPDRIILVIGPVEKLFDDDDSGEVSKAQDALLKVFERVLDVTAETDGVEIGHRVISCRLLAGPSQVGSVIGKGGKVVEKIRADTGCRIRVLNEKLPACTSPSNEIVEIEGYTSSVKKALLAVSRRIQDCLPADRAKVMGSRPYEVVQQETFAVPRETSANVHIDHRSWRSSASSTLSSKTNGNASGVHSLSGEVNRVSGLDPKALQHEVTFRILCANDRVGGIIGKGGSIVKALQNESGATISIGPSVVDCEDRLVTITAPENRESKYSPAQKAVVLVFSRSVEAGAEKGLDFGSKKESIVTARLVVPSNQVGCLLGKGGAIVSEMRKATGTGIRIIGANQVPKCASDNDQVVQISGVFSNVQNALYSATGRLRDHLFVSAQNSVRPRDPVPLGSQPIGVYSVAQGINNLALSQNVDHPSSPGLWAPQTVAGVNTRGINDVAKGLTSHKGSFELVSGSKTAIVTNTTIEIVVPDDVIDSIYGENGSNLTRLRQISGAKVTVHEPRPGASDRTIVISGTPDEAQAAQSLLQAFILTGS